MARQAKIYFQDQLAGILVEGDNGYSFSYDKEYLKTTNPKPISLTLPLTEHTYQNKVLFPFFDGLIPEGWLLEIGEKHWKLNPRDRFELLINLCRDAIGAVAVYPMEAENRELYYEEFKRQQKEVPELRKLKIATIFSFGQNEPEGDGVEDENSESTEGLSASHRDFLDHAITDYNLAFKTNYDTSSDKFQNYYKDVSLRMKNREIDMLIVVNMFLTGFDATTLNTLWVDKNLRMHGLLQAFSRTNRILNSIKTYGNIVCFRNLEDNTNEALALFGNKEAGGIVLLKTFDEYYYGYNDGKQDVRGYEDLVQELLAKFPIGVRIIGEEAQKEFVRLYSAILKMTNVLRSFDDFEGKEILSDRDVQDYRGMYIELYNSFRGQSGGDRENVIDDIEFEMELIKQVEINIDYILMLIHKYYESNMKDKEIVVNIQKAIDSSVDLRNKKELIEKFVESLTPSSNVDEDWQSYVKEQKEAELNQIIEEERLKEAETKSFVDNSFKNGEIQSAGTSFARILPPVSRFSRAGERTSRKERVLGRLKDYFDRYFNIS